MEYINADAGFSYFACKKLPEIGNLKLAPFAYTEHAAEQ